ncbi:pentatricopeptide repeat-containing protein At4g26680, mitochondrial-like [Solanum dulcamara]|uniref:pentatricopeptide repeat-containing protein At4g26680, mitochondrial-like n=1 Tax=Solanum dulcamara TaxID=45834 RepID=UPI002486A5C9|nr:pentatricopeptide repeat-containing protein At4g26680, mitochondrial-like [Solanum dulcamara]
MCMVYSILISIRWTKCIRCLLKRAWLKYNVATLQNEGCSRHGCSKLSHTCNGKKSHAVDILYNDTHCRCEVGNSEMGSRIFEEMANNGLKADILTYNALILGLCKEGKTKKAALVKELDDKANLVPHSSTFFYLISGQCARRNSDRAFQFYKSMVRGVFHPYNPTLTLLASTFIKNEGYDEAMKVLKEMLERSITLDLGMLTEICNLFLRCGREGAIIKLLQELEARRLMPEGFDQTTVISSTDGR